MKNINLVRHLRYKGSSTRLSRSKNDWDPARLYPYEPVDEHIEPSKEEIIREIFDKNYYHFGNKGKQSNDHYPLDSFDELRQWQHLYTHPNEPFLGWTWGSIISKYMLLVMPISIFGYFYYVYPKYSRERIGRTYMRRFNTRW